MEINTHMNLHELFDKCLNKNLIDLTISGRKDKLQDEVSKVKIRPVIIKNNLLFQVSEYKGTKVYHDNYSEADVRNYIEKMMTDNFKQAQFKMTDADAQVLSGKNSNMTIKYKKSCEVRCQKELSHNRNKKYILEEGKKVDFLVDLGVMTKEGKIVNQRYDKYRQINRFLEFIEDILPELDSTREQTIIDFGCGKSYLTFAVYYYLKVLKGMNIRIIGLDLKEDVIKGTWKDVKFVGNDFVLLQNEDKYNMFVFLADQQALTDHAKESEIIKESIGNVALDYLSVGLDPAKSTIFIQSQIPELAELTMYYMNLVSLARLERNPTVKTEIAQKGFGESIPTGFLVYPISQAADITAFKANYVPVGNDQKPMIEQTREIARSFNHTYNCDILVEPEGIYPENEAAGRLPGLDGNAKMSKSLGNGIFLSDDEDTVRKKVMSMYTDPNHIRVEDPGQIEGNMVFHYLDIFGREEDATTIAEMKEHYQRGGLGDVKTKRYLLEILERELAPIRERRLEYAKDMGEVFRMLEKGSQAAREVAGQTLAEVKEAMGINYF